MCEMSQLVVLGGMVKGHQLLHRDIGSRTLSLSLYCILLIILCMLSYNIYTLCTVVSRTIIDAFHPVFRLVSSLSLKDHDVGGKDEPKGGWVVFFFVLNFFNAGERVATLDLYLQRGKKQIKKSLVLILGMRLRLSDTITLYRLYVIGPKILDKNFTHESREWKGEILFFSWQIFVYYEPKVTEMK